MATAIRRAKLDQLCAEAVDLAREAAEAEAGPGQIGEHLGVQAEGDRVCSHLFACLHPGYRGWRWSVTVARASRAKRVTVDEVVLLPSEDALLAPAWVPWSERIEPGDVTPGVVMPTPDDDPRLEPGYTGGEDAAGTDPAEASITRALVAELGLGRERVLSPQGRQEAAERWLAGEAGPDNESTRQAPGNCVSCAYFVRLQGSLGRLFGACANVWSPRDGAVVSVDHGCGGHSDVVAEQREAELPPPVWETVSWEDPLFS
ncbi:DUF3027 domain-containing protein [Auraticoccus sp. F435]|uniref:DUF3027 domain-containing protein n=1 Tax=Auraticoccus cholistanensis TaxID=2656650 RepID=A0A6A9UYG1_9ACTN|nr:DUF3027 domain-containing protein [Auraticoccus cholistanensis]